MGQRARTLAICLIGVQPILPLPAARYRQGCGTAPFRPGAADIAGTRETARAMRGGAYFPGTSARRARIRSASSDYPQDGSGACVRIPTTVARMRRDCSTARSPAEALRRSAASRERASRRPRRAFSERSVIDRSSGFVVGLVSNCLNRYLPTTIDRGNDMKMAPLRSSRAHIPTMSRQSVVACNDRRCVAALSRIPKRLA